MPDTTRGATTRKQLTMTEPSTIQRDNLARDIMNAYYEASDGSGSRHWVEMADILHAKGYRKPRTITTVEELDALVMGAVIRDVDEEPMEKADDGWRYWVYDEAFPSRSLSLPATVLHEPEAEATNIDFALTTAAAAGVPMTEEQVREYIARGAEPEAEAAEFGVDECNGSGRCDVSKHVHGCYSDLGRCDEPAEHETTR